MTDNAFEREKTCYEQNNQQMRALSEQMSRVPTVAITLSGGLWFGASQTPSVDAEIRFILFLFAGIVNVGLALSCFRIRDVIQSYSEKVQEFAPKHYANGRPTHPILRKFSNYSMISIYVTLMIAAALLSFSSAFYFYWPFDKSWRHIGATVFALLLVGVGAYLFKQPTKKLQ